MDRTNSTGGDDAIPPALSAILDEMRSDEIETEDGVVRLDGYADRIESEVRRAHEEWEAVARAQDVAQTVMMEEIEKLRAPGSVAAMRKALKRVESELSTMNPRGWGDTLAYIRAALAAPPEPPSDTDKMREALEYVLQFDATDEAAEQDGLTDAERIAEYADHIEECQKRARAALAKEKAVVQNEG